MLKAVKKNNGVQASAALLARAGLFRGAERDVIETFAAAAVFQSFPKGRIVFQSGGKAGHFYVIQSGWVKLYRETLDGAQAVINVLTADHVFGELAIFEDGHYFYSAEVVEDAEVFVIPLSLLKSTVESNPVFAREMLSFMVGHRRQQSAEIEHRSIQNAPQRIGCFLLRLVDQSRKGPVQICLPYDKTLIAARLGMQPETFSRALARLRAETGIRVKGAIVEIDALEKLVEFSCGVCTSNFPCQDLPSEEKTTRIG